MSIHEVSYWCGQVWHTKCLREWADRRSNIITGWKFPAIKADRFTSYVMLGTISSPKLKYSEFCPECFGEIQNA